MANLFSNPLVLAERVVGSLIDTRSVVLYEQPDLTSDINQLLSANNLLSDDSESLTQPAILEQLANAGRLNELFTGIGLPVLSAINGFNMFGISYLSADINISSDLCQHPIETGQVVTDAAIINPIKATIRISVPTAFYTRIYESIYKYFSEKKYIMIQTKFGLYPNMVITQMPYKLDVSTVDRPQIDLSLEQVLEVQPQYIDTSNGIAQNETVTASDVDTVDLGRVDVASDTLPWEL